MRGTWKPPHQVGDMVKLRPKYVLQLNEGSYMNYTPVEATKVLEITDAYGVENGGAILIENTNIGSNWRWAEHFESAGGPW